MLRFAVAGMAAVILVLAGVVGFVACGDDAGGDKEQAPPADVPQFTRREVLASFESHLTGIAGSSGKVYLAQQMTEDCLCNYVGGHIWSVSCGKTVPGGEFRFYERTFTIEPIDQTAETTIIMLRRSD